MNIYKNKKKGSVYMNELMNMNEENFKWDSRQIAEWTGKEHFNVIRDIEDEIMKLKKDKMEEFVNLNFEVSSYQLHSNTRHYPMYRLTKIGVQQIAMRYSATIRAKVNMKLEEFQAISKPPLNYKAALYELIKKEEEKEMLMLKNEQLEQRATFAEETKALISDRKTATAMNTASRLSKKVDKLSKDIGFTKNYATIKKLEIYLRQKFDWRLLKKYSLDNGYHIKKVDDINYGAVNAYHANVWQAVYNIDLEELYLQNKKGR
jgi:Rha family phage regulatory protein